MSMPKIDELGELIRRIEMVDDQVEMVNHRVDGLRRDFDRVDDLRRDFDKLSDAVDRVKRDFSDHVSDSTIHHSHWWLDIEPKKGDLEGLAKLFAAHVAVPDTK